MCWKQAALRWRVEQRHQLDGRCLHLADSMVVLHCLFRGRSSSRKLRHTIMRVNSLIVATGLQPLWGYIDTHTRQNWIFEEIHQELSPVRGNQHRQLDLK